MNKKVNTAIFLILATLINLLIMVIITAGLMALCVIILKNSDTLPIFMALSFVIGIALSFIIYSSLMKLINNKFDLDKYITPMFNKNKRR